MPLWYHSTTYQRERIDTQRSPYKFPTLLFPFVFILCAGIVIEMALTGVQAVKDAFAAEGLAVATAYSFGATLMFVGTVLFSYMLMILTKKQFS